MEEAKKLSMIVEKKMQKFRSSKALRYIQIIQR